MLAALASADPVAEALALYAKVLGATTLAAAAHSLVAALVSDFGYGRASIGLHEQGRTRLMASSSLDVTNTQAELPQSLLGAMDEAIDQGVSLTWPAADAPAGLDTSWICIEHAALQRQVGVAVATVPLGVGGAVFGALCVERPDGSPIDADELARLERLMALAVPALRWMQHRRATGLPAATGLRSVPGLSVQQAAAGEPVHRAGIARVGPRHILKTGGRDASLA